MTRSHGILHTVPSRVIQINLSCARASARDVDIELVYLSLPIDISLLSRTSFVVQYLSSVVHRA